MTGRRSSLRAGATATISVLLLTAFAVEAGAAALRPRLQVSSGVRLNTRSKTKIPDEAIERLELKLAPKDAWWKFAPFIEARHNLDEGLWSRFEFGGEIGFKPFKNWIPPFSWFTLDNGLHYAAVKPGNDHPEWEIRPKFQIPLPWAVKSKPMSLYLLDEYTYDLEKGDGIRNEAAGGIKVPLPVRGVDMSFTLGWRHVDITHEADNDQIESSLHVTF